jgi:hypothetical protein
VSVTQPAGPVLRQLEEPFKSVRQREYLRRHHPEIYERWRRKYGDRPVSEASRPPQRYRIYIHGHSGRHVFGTHDPKEVTAWLVKLHQGRQPRPGGGYFMRHSDWSVERKHPDPRIGWTGLSGANHDALKRAVAKKVAENPPPPLWWQREGAVEDRFSGAFFTGAAEYLLEAPRRPRAGTLSDPQRRERIAAAVARWRGHMKSMPPALGRTRTTRRAVENVRGALQALYAHDGAMHTAVVRQLANLPDRHLAAMNPQDLKDLHAAVQDARPRRGRLFGAGTTEEHVGRLEQRLAKLRRRGVEPPAMSRPDEGGNGNEWLSGKFDGDLQKLGGENVNQVFTGSIGGRKVIVKPFVGMGRNGYSNLTQGKDSDREVIGPEIADALGMDGHARTAIRDVPGYGTSLVQEFMADGGQSARKYWEGRGEFKDISEDDLQDDLSEMALYDAVTGNMDRHYENFKVMPEPSAPSGYDAYPIDHGAILPDKPWAHAGKPGYGNFLSIEAQQNRELEPDEQQRLKKLLKNKALFDKIERRVPGAADPMRARIQMLLDHNQFPAYSDSFEGRPRRTDLTLEKFMQAGFEGGGRRR